MRHIFSMHRFQSVPDLVSGQALLRRAAGGQAMLLVVIMMGGMLFLITAVAGLLMFYQLQQAADTVNSAQAFFAADAALEKAQYEYFTNPAFVYDPRNPCFGNPPCAGPAVTLTNDASGNSFLVIPLPSVQNALTTITGEGRGPGGRTIRFLQSTFLVNPSAP